MIPQVQGRSLNTYQRNTYCGLTCVGGSEARKCPCDSPKQCAFLTPRRSSEPPKRIGLLARLGAYLRRGR